ncbi:MAG: hypothetical protein KAY50_07830 [Chitinophagaceae bacterium]|nr:hypothetical protein [Chitinophagaceae bacterium]
MIISIISIIVIIIHLLKLVNLVFKPKFLNFKVFGHIEQKWMMGFYYFAFILVLLVIVLDQFEVIQLFPENYYEK